MKWTYWWDRHSCLSAQPRIAAPPLGLQLISDGALILAASHPLLALRRGELTSAARAANGEFWREDGLLLKGGVAQAIQD